MKDWGNFISVWGAKLNAWSQSVMTQSAIFVSVVTIGGVLTSRGTPKLQETIQSINSPETPSYFGDRSPASITKSSINKTLSRKGATENAPSHAFRDSRPFKSPSLLPSITDSLPLPRIPTFRSMNPVMPTVNPVSSLDASSTSVSHPTVQDPSFIPSLAKSLVPIRSASPAIGINPSTTPTLPADPVFTTSAMNRTNADTFVVQGSCSANTSEVEIRVNGITEGNAPCSGETFSYTVSRTADLSYIMDAIAYDSVRKSSSLSGAIIWTRDTQAPAAPSLALTSPTLTSSTSSTFTVSDCTDSVSILIQNTATTPLSTDTHWQACTTTASATTYTLSGTGSRSLYAFSKDAAGNISPVSIAATVHLDQTAPAITLTKLTGGEVIPGSAAYTVTWSSSDTDLAANPISLSYSDDAGNTWIDIATGLAHSGTYSWSVPSLNKNTVRLRVSATDLASNVGISTSSSNFTIDSTAPVLDSLTLNHGVNTIGNNQIPVDVTVTETFNLSSICYSTTNSICGASGWLPYSASSIYVAPPVSASRTIYVWVRDEAGHTSNALSSPMALTVGEPPAVTLISPLPNGTSTYTSGSSMTLQWKISSTANLTANPISLKLTTDKGVTTTDVHTTLLNTTNNGCTVDTASGATGCATVTIPSSPAISATTSFRLILQATDINTSTGATMSGNFNVSNLSHFAGRDATLMGNSATSTKITLSTYTSMAFNSKGDLYILDSTGILKIAGNSGKVTREATVSTRTGIHLNKSDDTLYFAYSTTGVKKLLTNGSQDWVVGSTTATNFMPADDDLATSATLNVSSIAMDSAGRLYFYAGRSYTETVTPSVVTKWGAILYRLKTNGKLERLAGSYATDAAGVAGYSITSPDLTSPRTGGLGNGIASNSTRTGGITIRTLSNGSQMIYISAGDDKIYSMAISDDMSATPLIAVKSAALGAITRNILWSSNRNVNANPDQSGALLLFTHAGLKIYNPFTDTVTNDIPVPISGSQGTAGAIDSNGGIYFGTIIADNRILYIDPSSTAIGATYAGVDASTGDNGPATIAGLTNIYQATTDGSGNTWLNDYGAFNVRKINSSGVITTEYKRSDVLTTLFYSSGLTTTDGNNTSNTVVDAGLYANYPYQMSKITGLTTQSCRAFCAADSSGGNTSAAMTDSSNDAQNGLHAGRNIANTIISGAVAYNQYTKITQDGNALYVQLTERGVANNTLYRTSIKKITSVSNDATKIAMSSIAGYSQSSSLPALVANASLSMTAGSSVFDNQAGYSTHSFSDFDVYNGVVYVQDVSGYIFSTLDAGASQSSAKWTKHSAPSNWGFTIDRRATCAGKIYYLKWGVLYSHAYTAGTAGNSYTNPNTPVLIANLSSAISTSAMVIGWDKNMTATVPSILIADGPMVHRYAVPNCP